MAKVTKLPTVIDLKREVEMLTIVVAQLMAVMNDRQMLNDDDLFEVRYGGRLALGELGPDLGQPDGDVFARACNHAETYEESGFKKRVDYLLGYIDQTPDLRAQWDTWPGKPVSPAREAGRRHVEQSFARGG